MSTCSNCWVIARNIIIGRHKAVQIISKYYCLHLFVKVPCHAFPVITRPLVCYEMDQSVELLTHTQGVSQCRVHLLGSTCLPSVLLQKRGKNTSWHSENKEWNRRASVQVCVIWEAPPYIFRHRFGEIGPCTKHCGDFKAAESICAASKFLAMKYAGLGRIPSMLDIGTVLLRHSMTYRLWSSFPRHWETPRDIIGPENTFSHWLMLHWQRDVCQLACHLF